MPFYAKNALLIVALGLLLGATTTKVAWAREKTADSGGSNGDAGETAEIQNQNQQQKLMGFEALTRNEGMAVLRVALDSGHRAEAASDCSHFVHALYERAGFPYEYASSTDLYAGIDEFRRVATPQAGDLAVWRGHVGVVLDPAQHSFDSVLHSGPGVDYYDSPYWKRRGRPRFFRYVRLVPKESVSTIRSASWKPAGDATARDAAIENRTADRWHEPSRGVSANSSAGSNSAASNFAHLKSADNRLADSDTPRVVMVNSARPKPDQVGAAFLQGCADSEAALRGRDLLRSPRALVVFDHFEVNKVHLAGNQGWVEVRIGEVISVVSGKIAGKAVGKPDEGNGPQRQRWFLTREENKSWKLTPSRNAVYLPQHSAERVLAHELAELTETHSENANTNSNEELEKAELARLLDLLFEK